MNLSSLKTALLLSLCAVLCHGLQSEDSSASKPFLQLEDGDTVVFLGDSITHQCLYTQYIENFFYTRYPDRRIRFHNAGVSGDKASDALARFEEDVASFEPDHITLLLGMNDGKYEPYSGETVAEYKEGIGKLQSEIHAAGSELIALSPTMFDHLQAALRKNDPTFRFRDRSFDPDYNALLAYFGAWLRETSASNQASFVDLWSPLNDLTFAARQTRPDFSIIEDAIHPGAAGHFVMAHQILMKARPERIQISSLSIQAEEEKWVHDNEGRVTQLNASDTADSLSFVFLASSLPWVVPEKASETELRWGPSAPATFGYQLVGAGETLNREHLKVADLAEGTYELHIDGVDIGRFDHRQLREGVSLQSFPETPQWQQALRVAQLNRERNDRAVRPMRELWARVKGLRRKGDPEAFAKGYSELKARIDALHQSAIEYEKRIYEAAKPLPRTYKLKRVGP